MDNLEAFPFTVDRLLDTKRKRHITGGILISISMLFGGLAFTVFTINKDTDEEENINE